MSKKKKKTNTEEEKKAMAGIVWVVLAVIFLAIAITMLAAECAMSDGKDRFSSLEDLAKWQKIIGGTTWEVSYCNIDPNSLKIDLKYCKSFTFSNTWGTEINGNRVYNVFITSEKDGYKLTSQAYFTMDSPTGGTLRSNGRTYGINFSDMTEKTFDDSTYMMRLTYEGYGYIDSYVKNS